MKHIIVDFEMNLINKSFKNKGIEGMEIIEIGAVMLDDSFNEISTFKTFVRPEYNKYVDKKITKLTGIKMEMLKNAPSFNIAVREFVNWCTSMKDEFKIYAWSDSDYNQICSEIELKNYEVLGEERDVLLNSWRDLQKELGEAMGIERQMSLEMALFLLGEDYKGQKHRALDDAKNTIYILKVLNNNIQKVEILEKIRDVLEPKEIGTSIGDLIDFNNYNIAQGFDF